MNGMEVHQINKNGFFLLLKEKRNAIVEISNWKDAVETN